MNVAWDLISLKSPSMGGNKFVGIRRPHWQFDPINPLLELSESEVVVIDIDQELWEIEELRIKLSYIWYLIAHTMPTNLYRVKKSIAQIELPTLQSAACLGIGVDSDQKIEYHSGRAIMSSILVRWHIVKWIDRVDFVLVKLSTRFGP